MKRAAGDQNRGEEDTGSSAGVPGPGNPENPSNQRENEDQPEKKARQESEPSDDQAQLIGRTRVSLPQPAESKREEETSSTQDRLPQQDDSSDVNRPDDVSRDERRSSATVQGAPHMGASEFPAQLMDILQRNVAPDAIWFLEGGEAIGLHRDLIVEKVLNEHFRGMKFNSLVRNLNRWGFRRISHPSLKEKERGYHHLLFQRDKPDLVHRMKKDSNAKEVVRQLDLADGKPEEEGRGPTTQEAKTLDPSEAVDTSSSAKPAAGRPSPSTRSRAVGQSLPSAPQALLRQGSLGSQRQQLLLQGLAAQQLELQRQQQMAANLGSINSGTWGGLSSWNRPPHTLPAASPFTFGLQQQHLQASATAAQHLQASTTAAQHPPFASSVSRSPRNPPSNQLYSGDAASSRSQAEGKQREESQDQEDNEGNVRPSETEQR